MLTEGLVTVCDSPRVDLFVAVAPGPADRTLLVIHGGPDWDHTYLREPLAGRHRILWPDLRGCGRSTTGLADDEYDPDAVVRDLLALLDHFARPTRSTCWVSPTAVASPSGWPSPRRSG